VNVHYCWHRPGKRFRDNLYLCRHCGILIEECFCVSYGRTPDDKNCLACEGSGWCSFVRSRMQLLRDMVFGGSIPGSEAWDDPDR
jgi:hypothetical protein